MEDDDRRTEKGGKEGRERSLISEHGYKSCLSVNSAELMERMGNLQGKFGMAELQMDTTKIQLSIA